MGIMLCNSYLHSLASFTRGLEVNNTTIASCLFGTTSSGAYHGTANLKYMLKGVHTTGTTAGTVTIIDASATIWTYNPASANEFKEFNLPITEGAALKVQYSNANTTCTCIAVVTELVMAGIM